MATLTGSTIASTYAGLLSVTGAISTSGVEVVQDGAGTDTSLWLADERATIKLGTSSGDDFVVLRGSTEILKVEGDTDDVTLLDDLILISDSSVIKLGAGADFTITHDGTTGATLAGNPITITSGGAATWSTSAGALIVDSAASTLTLDGHTGVTVQSSNSGEVDITSAAAVDINATTTVDIDGTAISVDGTDDSNITITGSNKDLTLSVAGGSTQTLTISSAGTGADAIGISASAGGVTVGLGGGDGDDFIVDTTTLVVESDNNRVGIGTNSPADDVHLMGPTDTIAALLITAHGSSATGDYPVLRLFRSKGSTGSPSVVADGDYLGLIQFGGWLGSTGGDYYTNYDTGAQILVKATADPSDANEDIPSEMQFWTSPDGSTSMQQRMVIGDNGNVGIGETTPTFPLHVKGRDDASSPNYVAMFDNLGADSDSHGIQIQAGDTNHANDDGTHYIVFKESDGGTVGELDSDSGNLALSDASDERLKKNIVDTATKGLEIVNGARMRDFNWKKNDLPIKCGIIAQELQSVFPKAVKECDDEDKTLRIRKTDFIYVLVKAVQELSASNDALKARIEVLEG